MSGIIGTLIGIALVLVVVGVIWWAIQQLMPLIPLGEPFATIIRVLLTVILVLIVLWIIIVLLGAAGVPVGTPFRFGKLTSGTFAILSGWSSADLPQLLRGTHG